MKVAYEPDVPPSTDPVTVPATVEQRRNFASRANRDRPGKAGVSESRSRETERPSKSRLHGKQACALMIPQSCVRNSNINSRLGSQDVIVENSLGEQKRQSSSNVFSSRKL
jgi:hypothetical protein